MDVFELTKRLIDIPSISGNEQEMAVFIGSYLKDRGFEVELQEAAKGRPNVHARIGNPTVTLSSHTDTVPPYLPYREQDGFIYGRGACDAKGIIAAMIKAAEAVHENGVNDVGLLFVVGEEAGSIGARMANEVPSESRYLINGEPTESRLALGSKGALRMKLTSAGRAAHSAYPERGESAIEKLLDILEDFRAAAFPADSTLGRTTMNIGIIKGGVATNVIPAEAEAELLFRVVTDVSALKKRIEGIIAGRAEVSYSFECEAVVSERVDGMNLETTVVSFTTDIPLLTNWGKPILFGPGSILDAHTADEKIGKDDLERSVQIYAGMVTALMNKA